MSRLTNAKIDAKLAYINEQLGTRMEIDNFPLSGGRVLIVRGVTDGGESMPMCNERMAPQAFDRYLRGMIDLIALQRRMAQGDFK